LTNSLSSSLQTATLENFTLNLEAAPKYGDLAGFGARSLISLPPLPPLTPPEDVPYPNLRLSTSLPSLDISAGQQGRYWPSLNTNTSQPGHAISDTLPTPPSAESLDLKPPRLNQQAYSNMATVAVPSMAMPSTLDALNAPSSLTARRQATANLPAFELPPPSNLQYAANGNQRFHQLPNLNSSHSHSASVSVGQLLTPPSHSASDSVSPVSSSMNSATTSSNQGILTYTPTWWASGTTPGSFHTGFTPPTWSGHNPLFPPRSVFSPSSQSYMRNSNNSPTAGESQSLPPPPYDLGSLPPFQNHLSMSSPPNAPATSQQQQQNVLHALMNPPHSMPGPTQLSPVDAGDGSNQKLPPTPTMYGGSQSSSTPQQSTFSYPGPSPVQQSPHPGSAQSSRVSPPTSQASSNHDHAQSHFVRPPYPSYSLPPMPGPVMTNVNSPNGQMTMVGNMQQGMIPPGYNSGFVANTQSLYGSQPPQAPPPSNVERPFKCDQCPQSFNRNHDLKRHKRIHLAVKPFPCNHCDKSFSRKDALKVSPQAINTLNDVQPADR
jgi:hypothetical protein